MVGTLWLHPDGTSSVAVAADVEKESRRLTVEGAAPPFMGGLPWPWVDPLTGATYTLPAKARFDALHGLD